MSCGHPGISSGPDVGEIHYQGSRPQFANPVPANPLPRRGGEEATSELSLRAVATNRCTVIEAYGEIDIANAEELKGMIDSCVHGGTDQLIVDLSGIRFMDSSGLNVLVGTTRRLGAGCFGVVVSLPSIRRIFAITGIDRIIPVFESLSQAFQALETGTALSDPLAAGDASG